MNGRTCATTPVKPTRGESSGTVIGTDAKKPLRHRVHPAPAGSLAVRRELEHMTVKRVLVGRPLATHEEEHQRLPKRIALPVFASDAISSTAYATDEILVVLLAQAGIGAAAWHYLTPLAIV